MLAVGRGGESLAHPLGYSRRLNPTTTKTQKSDELCLVKLLHLARLQVQYPVLLDQRAIGKIRDVYRGFSLIQWDENLKNCTTLAILLEKSCNALPAHKICRF